PSRHPHVFPVDRELVDAKDAGTVLRNWESIKRSEKEQQEDGAEKSPRSGLDDIPRNMPAVMEANKIGSRAAEVGFVCPDTTGLFDKLQEEIGEIRAEMSAPAGERQAKIEVEVGDLLFTAVNLARHLKVNPEFALRAANA